MADLRIQNVQREDLPKLETVKADKQAKADNTLANALAGENKAVIGEQLEITTKQPEQVSKPAVISENPDDPPKYMHRIHPKVVKLPAKVDPSIYNEDIKYDEDGNPIYENEKYDENGYLIHKTMRNKDGSINSFWDYEYDGRYNTRQIWRYKDGSVFLFYDIEYDKTCDKPTRVIERDERGLLESCVDYEYDEKGNNVLTVKYDYHGNPIEIIDKDGTHPVETVEDFGSFGLNNHIGLKLGIVGKDKYDGLNIGTAFKHTFIDNKSLPIGNIAIEPSIGFGSMAKGMFLRTGLTMGTEYYINHNPKSAISLNFSRDDFGMCADKYKTNKHISLTYADLSYRRKFNIGKSSFRASLGVEGRKMREKTKGSPAESEYYVTPSGTLEWGLKDTCFGAKVNANLKHPSVEINFRPSFY